MHYNFFISHNILPFIICIGIILYIYYTEKAKNNILV